MASTPSKSRKSRTKPPKGRPAATSTISQPAVADHSTLTYLSTFSPRGDLFAFLSLAVDKHRLRIYDTATRQSVAEHVVDNARVTSLCWARLDPSDSQKHAAEDAEASHQPKRKRKKRNSQAVAPDVEDAPAPQVVVLGLSDGTVSLFSPSHGRIVRTLSHTSSTADILAVAADGQPSDHTSAIWTSSADGTIRLWDANKNAVVGSWTSDDRIPYSALATRPRADEEGRTDVLVAHHAIRLLSMSTSSSEMQLSENAQPKELARFTGHASSIRNLQWHSSSQFLSLAEADRFVYVWDVPEGSAEGRVVASIPLDSDARHFALSSSSLLTLSASGKISVFAFPQDLTAEAGSKQKIPNLSPKSTISVSSKKDADATAVVAASFAAGEQGHIHVARLVNGVQPVFDVVSYLDETGAFLEDITITSSAADLVNGVDGVAGAPTKRYNESSSLAVRSGNELGQDASMDDIAMRDVDGDLDVDLAELSLGQRLTALNGGRDTVQRASDSSDEEARPGTRDERRKADETIEAVPATSLTRTLIQALHSSDARLLETCLAHSDVTLIRNTVRRLPPQLAVPLITACVERLGRGARGGNMKGGGGGASSQRGTAMINWVRAVLAAHSGHLMTMPDLVARLSGLHTTLATRLTLQDSLLALSGRLDMVMSQIDMRASGPPAPLPLPKGKKAKRRQAKRYVEGESDAEEPARAQEDQMDIEVGVESGDDGGSVEDVELGADEDEEGSDEEEDEEDDEDDDEEDDEDEDGFESSKLNGFIDDEAEEYSEEEDDDESE